MTNKKIDLGEYIVTIYHNQDEGVLEVNVFDEGNELLESIVINNDDEDEDESDENYGFNLN